MIILPLDPHLADAAVEFEELGYLQTIDSVVEIHLNHSHQPPHPSAASEFDANLMISVFYQTYSILTVFRGRRTPPRENVGSVRRSPSAGPSDMLGLTP